jgi:hypothetical protein
LASNRGPDHDAVGIDGLIVLAVNPACVQVLVPVSLPTGIHKPGIPRTAWVGRNAQFLVV